MPKHHYSTAYVKYIESCWSLIVFIPFSLWLMKWGITLVCFMITAKNMEVLVIVPFNMEVPLVLVNLRNISWVINQPEKSGPHAAKPILKPITSKSQRIGKCHGAWLVIRITEKHRSYFYLAWSATFVMSCEVVRKFQADSTKVTQHCCWCCQPETS